MIAKFILSSSAVIILLVFNNVYFRPLRIRVKTLIPALAAVFIAVLFWQLVLDALLK
jgi:hypothetical protein